MPIDPMLVNGITPVISPLQAEGQAMSLRDMMLQSQIQQQALQMAQFQYQQAQLQAQKNAQAAALYKSLVDGSQGSNANSSPSTAPGVDPTQFGGGNAPPLPTGANGNPTLRSPTPDIASPMAGDGLPDIGNAPMRDNSALLYAAGPQNPAVDQLPPKMTLAEFIQASGRDPVAPNQLAPQLPAYDSSKLAASFGQLSQPTQDAQPTGQPSGQPTGQPAAQPVPSPAPGPTPIPVGKSGAPIALPVGGQLTPADRVALMAHAQGLAGNMSQASELWKQSADMRTKQAEADKFQSEAQKNALESAEKANELVASHLQAVLNAPPDQRQAVYDGAVADVVSKGYAKAGELPSSVPDEAALQAQITAHQTVAHQIDAAKQALEEKKNSEEQKRVQALLPMQVEDAKQKANAAALATVAPQLAQANNQGQWDAALGQIKDRAVRAQFDQTFSSAARERARQLGLTAVEQVTTAQTKQRDAQTAKSENTRNAIEGERLNIERQRFGFDTGEGVSPAAQAIASGKMNPQGVRMMLRTNPGILGQVLKVDPDFDENTIDQRAQVLKEFSNTSAGKAGGQVLALNTAIHHADLFKQVAMALNNTTFRPGNEAYNRFLTEFGSAAPNNVALVGQVLAEEVAKLTKGGVPTAGEAEKISKLIGKNGSPEQIAQGADTLLSIAAGRATPLLEQVNNAKLQKLVPVILPSSKEILQRQGYDPETMKKRTATTKQNPFAESQPRPNSQTAGKKNPFE